MAKRYDRYCPMAHALDLVGERWACWSSSSSCTAPSATATSPTTFPASAPTSSPRGCATSRPTASSPSAPCPPPAASRVYELTEYGRPLRPAMRELAMWGARSLGPPTARATACSRAGCPTPSTSCSRRSRPRAVSSSVTDGEVASLVDGEASSVADRRPRRRGHRAARRRIYQMFVERDLDVVEIEGDRRLVEELLAVSPSRIDAPVPA